MDNLSQPGERRWMGQPLAGGIAIGRIAVYGQGHPPEVPKYRIAPSDIEHEVTRFQQALDRAREELQEVEQRFSQEMGHISRHLNRMNFGWLSAGEQAV